MLVQYLINSTGAATKLVEDEIFGKKTYKAVKEFPKHYNGIGSLYADGVVSFPTSTLWATPGGVYTIYVLNYVYLQNNRPYYNNLRMDPGLPSKLCNLSAA